MVKFISHNQGTVVGIILTVILLVWTFGCESKVRSPISDNMVTRPELNLEIDLTVKRLESELDMIQKQAALQFLTLDRQDVFKQKLFNFAALSVESNTFNPTGLITLAGTLLGLGFGVDNRIKDKVIKNRPINNKPTPTDTT
jgi:hypothetical protein